MIPFLATVLLVALGVSLGQWQERRALEKATLQAQLSQRSAMAPLEVTARPLDPLETQALQYRPVRVTGQFVRDWPLFLDNRPQQGKAGFYLLMPLRIAGSDMHVLVARGWVPRYTGEHHRLPDFTTPQGLVTIVGRARPAMGRVMQLGDPAPVRAGAILQNLEPAEFGAASGLAVQGFFIEQTGPTAPGEGLVRDWPAPSLGLDKHRGYAFQWYALALMALLFFVLTGFRRGTKQTD